MSEVELKPCPFCGGDVTVKSLHGTYTDPNLNLYIVNCKCRRACDTEAEAIKAWNTRPLESEQEGK